MKIYLSVDMEGIAGITCWDEATQTHPDYPQFQQLLTAEVIAACEGATAAGATEIYIKDAHWTGRNILLADLPANTRIIRGWSGSPMGAFQELDKSFDAILLIGWHAAAGAEANPLAHTITTKIESVRLNGVPLSEFGLYARLAAYCGVPVAFLSGDEAICAESALYNPAIHTCPVSYGVGASSVSLSPTAARHAIRQGVTTALKRDIPRAHPSLPAHFDIDVTYNTPHHAYQFSWYPGAKHIGNRTIRFETPDFFEIKRFLQFVT
jgi:D-amino peptidase